MCVSFAAHVVMGLTWTRVLWPQEVRLRISVEAIEDNILCINNH